MRLRQMICILMLSALVGCASNPKSASPYQTVGAEPRRDADLARQQNALAVDLMEKKEYAKAEPFLKAALAADVMCGPAHNNLGKLYFFQKKLYLAAWEFQYAAKLMPNAAEPANNLGLVFEAAGKLDDAAESYNKAISLEPENLHAMSNLARARARRGDRDPSMRELLQKLVMRETRPEWLSWEQATLSKLEAHTPEP